METDSPIKIKLRFFGYYLFITLILFLARSYIGGLFVLLFYLFVFAPVISILHLLIVLSFVRYYQFFENEHPLKGEDVRYRLILADESIFPIPRMSLHFKRIHPYLETVTEDITLFLSGGKRIEREYTIRCPYRGIYTIGLQRIAYEDFLGILEISRKIWYRTFYVYPRILQLKSIPHTFRYSIAERQSIASDIIEDTTLFSELRDYRQNESLRHVYWKKFASTGRPYIKEYSISTEPSVSIFLDMRKGRLSGTIIITHILDSLLANIAERSKLKEASPLILFNLTGAERIEETEHQIRRMKDRGARIIIIRDSNTIPEELAGNV